MLLHKMFELFSLSNFFSIQAKPKILFAPGPTQKLGLLGCFWLAFEHSKTQLQKKKTF